VANTVIAFPALILPKQKSLVPDLTVVGAMLILPTVTEPQVKDALILEMIHSTAEISMILSNAQLDGYATQILDNAQLESQEKVLDLPIPVLLSATKDHLYKRKDSDAIFLIILAKNVPRMICLVRLIEVLLAQTVKTQPSNINVTRPIQMLQNVTNVLQLEVPDAWTTTLLAYPVLNQQTSSHATIRP